MPEGPGRRTGLHHSSAGPCRSTANILRDLDEDAAMGRLYLPAEALAAAGISSDDPGDVLSHSALNVACRWLAARAHEHYAAAEVILAKRPAGRLRTPRIMAAVYNAILKRMEAVGWRAPRARVSLSKTTLASILAAATHVVVDLMRHASDGVAMIGAGLAGLSAATVLQRRVVMHVNP